MSLLHRSDRGGNFPGQGEQQGHGVLRRGDNIAVGRVDHQDPAKARALQIDVIHPDPGSGDNLEPVAGAEDFIVHICGAAHQKSVAIPDDHD